MRHERLYLNDIVEAADAIAAFIAGVTPEEFQASDLLRSAVVHKLAVIGEAAARLSDATTALGPEVEWTRIVGFRNILIHAYFGIDWDIVWEAARDRCPELRTQVAGILDRPLGPSGATP